MAQCRFEGDEGQTRLAEALGSRLNVPVEGLGGPPDLVGALAARALMKLEFPEKGL